MTSERQKEIQRLAAEVSKKLADEGRLVEAGFIAMLKIETLMMPNSEIDDLRVAYMAGAQHLYASMMTIMDAGEEPTDRDMKRMELIHNELEAFRAELELRTGPTGGSA